MYKYGYDTFRTFQREDHTRSLSLRFNREFERNKGYKISYNNADIHLSFPNGMTCVSFSIPKLLFGGNNMELADINEAIEAIDVMSELLGLDFSEFGISRLDTAINIVSSIKAKFLSEHLKNPAYFKGSTLKRNGVYYHTAKCLSDSARVLLFYNKENCVRIEARLMSKHKLGIHASDLFKSQLKHEALVSELLKESFYVNSTYYLYDLVMSANPEKQKSKKVKEESKVIFSELKSSLDANLQYTLPSQFLR
jgi:hypothetical protein